MLARLPVRVATPLVPRPPPTVPTVGAGRPGPGCDLPSVCYVPTWAVVGRVTAGGVRLVDRQFDRRSGKEWHLLPVSFAPS